MNSFDLIASASDPAVQRIKDLTKHSRASVKTVLIEDEEPLLESINAGVEFIEVYVLDSITPPPQVVESCAAHDIPLRLLALSVATTLFRSEKRAKIFGVARVPRPSHIADLNADTRDVVLLDGVKIVGNIGAIIRTSYALGASGIILVDSDLPTIADRRLIRASRGYVFSLPIVLMSREEAISALPDLHARTVILDGNATEPAHSLSSVTERLLLIFGGEKYGASSELLSSSSESVAIPMNPAVESLNVSVAAGITLSMRYSHNLSRIPDRN